ncbi:hypothetical protein PRIPAC_81899 [Pristionchus pacificus]|uniref:Lipase n=1 Tax=Pristionchus pacificus TaxID=54126 RepID=A0A2A6CMX1_PRIPA|nr:hypothetical protein PRIPAC_81899 [Pristionchus pacificus]|eukprot:PDM79459.1 lipase [Pristionchus pacificus]
MLKTFASTPILLLALVAAEDGKDYGIPNWSCDAEVMKKSKTKPINVHSLRFADIDIIGALGDSLTAGNGAGAAVNDAVAVLIQYRGLPFGIGGDKSLDEHVTLTNILKKFNPNLFGYSTGTGSANVWQTAHLNTAIPGAATVDLYGQAGDLIRRMKEHPEIDFQNQWKLIHIFIGANDICDWCDYPDMVSDQHFRDNLNKAVQLLKDNLPKTIVVLVGMFDLSLLRKIDKDKYFCDKLHAVECPCEQEFDFPTEDISAQCKRYMSVEQELMDGRFDTTDDFTLVIQPFFEEITEPPMTPDGEPDLTFFAPDCFHFSAYGHAVVAKALWNNIVQPVGMKDRYANLTDLSGALACPDKKLIVFLDNEPLEAYLMKKKRHTTAIRDPTTAKETRDF